MKNMEVIKIGIGREIFGEKELEFISQNNNSELIESIRNSKIDKEKEWITESILLAIKNNGAINFIIDRNTVYGFIEIKKQFK